MLTICRPQAWKKVLLVDHSQHPMNYETSGPCISSLGRSSPSWQHWVTHNIMAMDLGATSPRCLQWPTSGPPTCWERPPSCPYSNLPLLEATPVCWDYKSLSCLLSSQPTPLTSSVFLERAHPRCERAWQGFVVFKTGHKHQTAITWCTNTLLVTKWLPTRQISTICPGVHAQNIDKPPITDAVYNWTLPGTANYNFSRYFTHWGINFETDQKWIFPPVTGYIFWEVGPQKLL